MFVQARQVNKTCSFCCRGVALVSVIQLSPAFSVVLTSIRTTSPRQAIGVTRAPSVISAVPLDVKKSLHVCGTQTLSVLRIASQGKRRCIPSYRVDSRLTPSQCETSLQSNAVSHWLGANLESALELCYVYWPQGTNVGKIWMAIHKVCTNEYIWNVCKRKPFGGQLRWLLWTKKIWVYNEYPVVLCRM